MIPVWLVVAVGIVAALVIGWGWSRVERRVK